MPLTSSPRRALGVFAVSAIGMSTAIIGIGGVAQATGPVALTTSDTLTIPAGDCTVEWTLNGAHGASAAGGAGGAGAHLVIHMNVAPGDVLNVAPVTLPGGAAGTGGGAGGAGIGLNVEGNLEAAAAGGGGAGSWSNGGDADTAGGGYGGTTYTYDGGQPGTDSAVGVGGSAGGDPTGTDGADGVSHTGGAGGGPGGGGGGGGAFGGGGGATDGTDGTGGGGGGTLNPTGEEVTAATGAASITYEYQACTAEQTPLAPSDLTAQGSDGTLTVDFTTNWNDAGPDTFEYQLDSGAWTPFTPGNSPDGNSELVLHSLTNGTPYTVHVRGVSSDGVPGPAGSVTGTPFKPIGAPTNVAYTVSGNVVTITWDAPATTGTFALAGYQAGLGYNWGQSGGLAFMCETDVSVHVCKAPAPPGPNYTFAVNAVDAQGNAGDPSQMVNVSKIAPPASVPASSGALAVPSGPGATGSVVKGQQVTLHGTGYAPNSLISVIVYSTPQVLTTVMTDGSGSFTVSVTVPAGLPDGHHTLVAAGVDPSGQTRYLTLGVTVTAGSAELAYTGASIVGPGIAGLVALTVGTGLLVLSRRRRTIQ